MRANTVVDPEKVPSVPPAAVPADAAPRRPTGCAVFPTGLLTALGSLQPPEPTFGPDVPAKLVNSFSSLLLKGLHRPPANVPLLQAPRQNGELLGSLAESVRSRDRLEEAGQGVVGAIGSGILSGFSCLLASRRGRDHLCPVRYDAPLVRSPRPTDGAAAHSHPSAAGQSFSTRRWDKLDGIASSSAKVFLTR